MGKQRSKAHDLKLLASTPYNSAKSLSNITCKPRIVKIRDSILSAGDDMDFAGIGMYTSSRKK
jgi:hypothetical protein